MISFTLNYNIGAECIYWDKLIQQNNKIVKNDPNNIMANFNLVVSLANTGKIQESYQLINKLNEKTSMQYFSEIITPYIEKLDVDNDNILLLNYAAFYELIKNNHKPAINYFKQIKILAPRNIWIQNYLASCYIEIEDFQTAENFIKESQSICDSDFSHLLMGLIHYKKGNFIGAVVEFSKSGELFNAVLSEIS